jgi:hypothetical protein
VKVIETSSLERLLDELKIIQKIKGDENIVNFMSYDRNQLENPNIVFQILIEMLLADAEKLS